MYHFDRSQSWLDYHIKHFRSQCHYSSIMSNPSYNDEGLKLNRSRQVSRYQPYWPAVTASRVTQPVSVCLPPRPATAVAKTRARPVPPAATSGAEHHVSHVTRKFVEHLVLTAIVYIWSVLTRLPWEHTWHLGPVNDILIFSCINFLNFN